MKSILPLIFLLLQFLATSHAQNTFNKFITLDSVYTIFTGITTTDSCYYATAITSRDSIFFFAAGLQFVKISPEGDVFPLNHFTMPDKSIDAWFGTLEQMEDGNFIKSGITFDSTMKAFLVKLDDQGDTLFYKEFFNPFYPTEVYIRPKDLTLGPNQTIWMISEIGNPNGILHTDVHLIVLDSSGNELWQTLYGSVHYNEDALSIKFFDNKFYIGTRYTDLNLYNSNNFIRSYILKIDTLGNILDEYYSPIDTLLERGARDLLPTQDGGLIVISNIGDEFWNGLNSYLAFADPVYYKLNANFEKEWELKFTPPHFTSLNIARKIIPSNEGDGYVTVANGSIFPDSTGLEAGHIGWLSKITESGTFEWTRYFAYPDAGEWDFHDVYDLQPGIDGGYIFCGQVDDNSQGATEPTQNGWVVKVDDYGCLVPGCHLVNTKELSVPTLNLLLYPNPTASDLHIYVHSEKSIKEGMIRMIDQQGRIVQSFPHVLNDITYTVSVADLTPGVYYVQVISGDGVMVTEELVVQ